MNEHTRRARHGILGGALLAAIVALSPGLAAHHGWGGYHDDEFELTGTVESGVSLAGPHGTMRVRAEGQVWDVVLAPPARVQRAGLNVDTIPVGAKVTVHGHRHRDANKFEVKTERVTFKGKTYNVYPDRT